MKNLINCTVWLLALASVCLTAQAQQKYIIKGRINGLTTSMKLTLHYSPKTNEYIEDSVIVKDGSFQMQGIIMRPLHVTISLSPVGGRSAKAMSNQVSWLQMRPRSFYLTGGLTTIEGDNLHDATIRNPVQNEYMKLIVALNLLEKPIEAIDSMLYNNHDADSVKMLKERRLEIVKQREKVVIDFVKTHPDSYISFDLVKEKAIAITDTEMFEGMFNSLSSSFRNSPEGKLMAQNLAMAKQLANGHSAIPFTQADSSGKPVSLAGLKGKYVLIDFWASWCGWCREEYPYLQKAYAQYKDKNFEIIGVSMDDNRKLWVDDIKRNAFPWLEVCDLKGRNNAVAKAYGVSAIPRNFLIDPNGVIVAKDLRREALLEKLGKIFNN